MYYFRNKNHRLREKLLLLTDLCFKPGHPACSSSPFPCFIYTQSSCYVNVRMKWKKDTFYDSIDVINKSKDLRTILSLKNIIAQSPDGSIPISAVSKMRRTFEISDRVAVFLRKYPSFFEEFTGPCYNLPWFRLTPEAVALDSEEKQVFEERSLEFLDRLRRLILMTRERKLPLQIIQGMQWYLGFPEDFTKKFVEEEEKERRADYRWFRLVGFGDGVRGLCVIDDEHVVLTPLSVIQRNALKSTPSEGPVSEPSLPCNIPFPLYPSKGVRLKQKIANWLEGFQKLPYLSPYEHHYNCDLNSGGDLLEKRVVGVLHELLCLMVDHSAERRRLLCLRKHLGLPQKFGRVFERHPHIFYLHMKNKTCYVVLKEAYHGGMASTIEMHPMLGVRMKYVRLMNESDVVLRKRRSREPKSKTEEKCCLFMHETDHSHSNFLERFKISGGMPDSSNMTSTTVE